VSAQSVQIIKEFGRVTAGLLAQGYIIDMGDLGTIRPTLSAKSVDSEKECTAETIRSRGILYKSRGDFADEIKGISLSITNLGGSSGSPADDDDGDDNTTGGGTPGGGSSGGDDLVG
jgi:hypothetical protein